MADQYAQKRYGYAGKSEAFVVDPDKVNLVADKSHPLYDPRVHNPPDPAFVQKLLMEGGCSDEIILYFTRDPETKEPISYVIDGRQRVINMRAANRKREAEGSPKMLLRAQKLACKPEELPYLVVRFNRHTNTTPAQRAEHAAHMVNRLNCPIDRVAEEWGVSVQTIRNWIRSTEPQPERKPRAPVGPKALGRKALTHISVAISRAGDGSITPETAAFASFVGGNEKALDAYPTLKAIVLEAQNPKPVKARKEKAVS